MNNLHKKFRGYLWGVMLCVMSMPHALASSDSVDLPTHYLTVGETLSLRANSVKRVAVGNGDILQVKVLKDTKEVLTIAKSPGISDLVIWNLKGEREQHIIEVDGYVGGLSKGEMHQLLDGVEGITVKPVNNAYIIEGMTKTVREHERIKAIAEAYPNIQSLAFPPEFEHKQTVLLHAQFLEVKRNALEKVGIDWADLANGPVFSFLGDFSTNNAFRGAWLPEGAHPNVAYENLVPLNLTGGTNYLGLSTTVSSVINLLKNNGDAKLLAEPTLSCISGGSANFLAGGEVPIPLRGSDGDISVTFKEFGIKLDIRPLIDKQGYIQTEVDVEVSAVDPAISVMGVPGFLTRKASTQMHAFDGQTIVLAGLFSQEGSKSIDKVPGFGDVPIVGELFKSREFRNNESELVVLVTPKIVKNQEEESSKGLKLFERLNDESDKTLKFSLMD